jgi:hypothetical protein
MELKNHLKNIKSACFKYGIRVLYIIGSRARGDFNQNSDTDFLVSFKNLEEPGIADRYFEFKEFLESELNTKVDLIEESAVKNPIFKKTIDREKVLIYE